MNRRRCCCEGDCAVVSTNWGGACVDNPTSVISDGWTVDVTGTWTLEAADGDASFVCNLVLTGNGQIVNEAKTQKEAQVIRVQLGDGVNDPEAGSVFRIKFNYKSDSEYHYVDIAENEFKVFSSTTGQIGDTELTGWGGDPEDDGGWGVCFGVSGALQTGGTFADSQPATRCLSLFQGGRRFGLGSGTGNGAATLKFNSAVLEEHYDTFPICDQCCCHECGDNCLEDTLNVSVTSPWCCYDGDQFQIVKPNTCDGYGDGAEWLPELPLRGPACDGWVPGCGPVGHEGFEWPFKLTCVDINATPPWMGYKLEADVGGNSSCDAKVTFFPVDGSCNPLYLKFFFEQWGENAEGHYDICPDNPNSGPGQVDMGPTTFEITE